jgi:DNA-binding transcriptional regulator YiaG
MNNSTPTEIKTRVTRLFRYMGAKNTSEGAETLGVSSRTVSRWFNGHCSPSRVSLRLIELQEKEHCHA